MNNAKITIAVVCPTYNSEKFIIDALLSVVNQTRKPDEIIISDDGSVDTTVSIASRFAHEHKQFTISVLENVHQGPGAARNHGIKRSRSEWIALLDSDDLWYPEKLAIVEQHISQYPEYNLFCHSEVKKNVVGHDSPLYYYKDYNPNKDLVRQLYWKNFFSTSAVVCRKDLFEKAGYFNEHLYSAQDYEMWLRMAPWMKPYHIRDILGVYRLHQGNISSASFRKRYKNALTVLNTHRPQVGWGLYSVRTLKISLSFFKSYILDNGKL